MMEKASFRASMDRATGPILNKWRIELNSLFGKPGVDPAADTIFSVGFNPKMPQKCEGIRIDPPISLAISKGESPAATAAAPPPGLPPGGPSRTPGVLGSP